MPAKKCLCKLAPVLICLLLLLAGCKSEEPILESPDGKLQEQTTRLDEDIPSDDAVTDENKGSDAKALSQELDVDTNTDNAVYAEKDGDVDDIWIEKVNTQLALIPENIRKAFLSDGWTVYVTDMDINLTYYGGAYGSVLGSTSYRDGKIFIEDREDAVNEAPIHELGHWLDFYNGYVTDTAEFNQVYVADCTAFIQGYSSTYIRDKKELFAEGFWQYVINPQKLEMTAPNLYWFIKDVAESI